MLAAFDYCPLELGFLSLYAEMRVEPIALDALRLLSREFSDKLPGPCLLNFLTSNGRFWGLNLGNWVRKS
jgi:hypothetical protein